MSKKVSKAVQEHVNNFYARLAAVAAKQAVLEIKRGSQSEAKRWAFQTEEWLVNAGADATRWIFRLPEA